MKRKIYSDRHRKFHVFFRNIFQKLNIFHWILKKQNTPLEIDPLTGIYNQFGINFYLKELTPHPSQSYSIVLLNIDNYIKIQNYHGLKAAELILQKTAELLSANIRQTDLVGKYGENEFIIILSNISLDDASEVAKRCSDLIQNLSVQLNSELIEIKVSCGVSVSEKDLVSDNVLQYADRALFLAKTSGSNQVRDQRAIFA